jgi:hypothetical protein
MIGPVGTYLAFDLPVTLVACIQYMLPEEDDESGQ